MVTDTLDNLHAEGVMLPHAEDQLAAQLPFAARAQARSAAHECARALRTALASDPRLHFTDTLPEDGSEEFRDCVMRYAASLGAVEVLPERVVLAVKELVRDAARENGVSARVLTDAAVRWAIAAYFSPAREVPAPGEGTLLVRAGTTFAVRAPR